MWPRHEIACCGSSIGRTNTDRKATSGAVVPEIDGRNINRYKFVHMLLRREAAMCEWRFHNRGID